MPCSIAEGSLGHSVEKNITTTVNLLEVDLLAECQKVSVNKSPRVRGSVLRNPDYTWNPEPMFQQSRTQSLQAFGQGDQKAWRLWVRDWCSTNNESGNSVPGIRNRWRGIQNPRLCCIPLHGRNKYWTNPFLQIRTRINRLAGLPITQVGTEPFHLPSSLQNNVFLPTNENPSSQVK